MIIPIFDLIEFLCYASQRSDCPLFLQNKMVFSLSHFVPEILGRKVGLIVHENVLFNCFKAFRINFLLDFRSNCPPFSLLLDHFTPTFLQNPIISIFYHSLNPVIENVVNYLRTKSLVVSTMVDHNQYDSLPDPTASDKINEQATKNIKILVTKVG